MDLGNFLDEKHIKQEIGDNIYSPVQMDIVEQQIQIKEKPRYEFSDWQERVGNMLMQGYHKKDILARYQSNIKIANNFSQVEQFIDQNDGLLGTVIIDCRLNNDTKYASKMKKFNKYAINCECGTYKQSYIRKNSSDGSIDGLLNESAKMIKSKVAYCKKSGLPVIKSFNAIKISKLNEVVDTLVSDGYITQKKGKAIKSSKNILSDLQDLFVNKVGVYTFNNKKGKLDKTAQQYKLSEMDVEADVINVSGNLDMDMLKQNDEQFRNVELLNNDYNLTVDVDNEVYGDDIVFQDVKEDFAFDELNQGKVEQFEVQDFDNLQIDDEEYIDNEWFDKSQIQIEDKDFDKKNKELDISDKYSFDF